MFEGLKRRWSQLTEKDPLYIGEPAYFLPPILATEPIPYLVAGDGEGSVTGLLNADGERITTREQLDREVHPAIQNLMREALGNSVTLEDFLTE